MAPLASPWTLPAQLVAHQTCVVDIRRPVAASLGDINYLITIGTHPAAWPVVCLPLVEARNVSFAILWHISKPVQFLCFSLWNLALSHGRYQPCPLYSVSFVNANCMDGQRHLKW